MLTTDDGVRLHYEEAGSGTPIVFVHEFAGDARSWEPQLRYFSRRYRCIAYCARSICKASSTARMSMGANATLHFGLTYPQRARSLTFAGGGYGSHPATRKEFQESSRANAATIREKGMRHFADTYGRGPARVQLQKKDPRGFDEYLQQLAAHSAEGSANTMLGVQSRRPSFYDMSAAIAQLQVPLLILVGDEDEPSIEASLMVKRTAPRAAMALRPSSGHGINLEEPALFNQLLDDFLHQVEARP